MEVRVSPAQDAADLDLVRMLFGEYANAIGIDLAFQGFEAELATLPGAYARPRGALLLARCHVAGPLGCIALRPLQSPVACEIKRLYVRSEGRSAGVGRALLIAGIAFAATAQYRHLMLDTLPSMTAAIALYRSVGFTPIPPYRDNPVAGLLYFGKRLDH